MADTSPHPAAFPDDAASEIPLTVADAFSVRGRTVIVTGAAGWIGRKIAQIFASNGAKTVLTDRPGPALDATAAPGETLTVPADLTSRADLSALVDKSVAHFGGLDAIVHCGGIPMSSPTLSNEAEEEFDRLFHTNLKSAWLLARLAAPHLEKSEGSIVHIASVNGHRPMFPGVLYAATKAGLISMTREMAVELGAKNIRVNSVSPGVIIQFNRTLAWMREQLAPDAYAGYEALVRGHFPEAGRMHQPLRRGGRPVDVAMACVYLVSPAARFVTGADVLVDGGFVHQFSAGHREDDPFWTRLRDYLRNLPREAWKKEPPEWVHKK